MILIDQGQKRISENNRRRESSIGCISRNTSISRIDLVGPYQTRKCIFTEVAFEKDEVLRFGMEDGTCWRLEAIGEKLGVSKERARQIEHQAIEKLQKQGADLGLEDFLE